MKAPDENNPSNENIVRVLLADENPVRKKNALAWLSDERFLVSTAADGFEALAQVVTNRPDIVFANETMPKLDGYQLCSLIKSNTDFKQLAVIMLADEHNVSGSERQRLSGCDSLLCNPTNANAYISIIDQFACTASS